MMNTDPTFICPHPRNPRACDKCRARKIRCLPADKGAERGSCRRCIKFGYACSNASSSAAQHYGRKEEASLKHTPERKRNNNIDPLKDVVSGLCESNPPPTSGINDLLDFHQRAFRKEEGSNSSMPNETSLPTPESIDPSHATGSFSLSSTDRPPNMTMPEAESLLTLFRQREQYFPFITLPSSITATTMTRFQPFLLLAILTVCSSHKPRLQARTDERFRRVLSERVILDGERRVDYVRGLLVYIVWCPMYLRPLKMQIRRYMRIAADMALDLGLHRNFENKAEEERMAYLGTCYLSSFVDSQWSKLDETRLKIDFPLRSQMEGHVSLKNGMHYIRLQELVGRVARYTSDARISAVGCEDSPFTEENDILQAQTARFKRELDHRVSDLPSAMRNTAPTLLTTHYIKISIAYIPLKPFLQAKSKPSSSTSPSPHPTRSVSPSHLLTHAASTFHEITSFLSTFLSLPSSEYIRFSIREWSQLVLTISISSNLCFSRPFQPANTSRCPHQRDKDGAEWKTFQSQSRAEMLVYLKSLTNRMRNISVSSGSDKVPDMFYMMESVLGLLVKNYAPPATLPTPTNSAILGNSKTAPDTVQDTTPLTDVDGERTASCLHTERTPDPSLNSPSTSSSSRCPILNGSIQETDFWRALEENTVIDNGWDGVGTGVPCENSAGGLSIDDLMNHPQDWPSVFGEWVVDMNCLPE
ncbi:hypothetical protein BDV06DRAFT_221604 [Aspergillus oleicola]